MKSKTLALITLVVLGCRLASAQIGTFTFWDSAGTQTTCDYIVITYNSGGVVAGYDDAINCGLAANAPVVGLDATTPALGLPAHGKGAVVGDGIYDASCLCYSGLQWTLWLSHKASKQQHGYFTGRYGWIGLAGSYTGFYFGDNYGYLGAGYPAGDVASHGTAAGKLSNKLKK